ncbi:hypothetical protein C1645_737821 [Glomus cerebriforme]|uniref:Uncharacterized protein n=1 Tax=Glomus cerebriforme TaxID=658196 RepID=A0A397T648_9GLOM|nr:hypothetical protein C1645_737821 [Glomus cerebriforme]
MSYKHVFGEINKLEFNAYNENNNSRWAAIISDLDKGQAKRLSLALNFLYNSLSLEEHLLYVLKSCLIHFERNVTTPFDTNVSECSHSNINREETQLRLKTTIFHLWNYDLNLYRRFYNNR